MDRFGKIVLIEAVLGAFLLMSVSLLTYLPPARINPPFQGLNASARVDDLKMGLTITPGEVGENVFQLKLVSNGAAATSVKQALLRFTPLSTNLPPSEGELLAQGNGIYSAKGTYFGQPGKWQVQAVVRRANKFDAYANFNFSIHNPGEANPEAATPRQAGVLFLIMGLIVVLLAVSMPFRPGIRLASGILPFLLMLGLGMYFLTLPGEGDHLTGQPDRARQPVHCGRPGGLCEELRPLPRGLGQGRWPGWDKSQPAPGRLDQTRSPGRAHGCPALRLDHERPAGTRMPAWKNKLSDTDRWNLVNYMRYLAQNAAPAFAVNNSYMKT